MKIIENESYSPVIQFYDLGNSIDEGIDGFNFEFYFKFKRND